MRLLLVEDSPDIGPMLIEALTHRGHVADLATTGAEALAAFHPAAYDAVVLDVGLPDLSGVEVCRRLRSQDPDVAIIMLTGNVEVSQRIEGLDAGADDYLPKPFSLAELDARLRALGRRRGRPAHSVLTARDLVVDAAARTVERRGHPVPVTGREYAMVELLVRRAGHVVRREELVEQLWDHAAEVSDNTIDVLVASVRRKLEAAYPGERLLETVRGVGYRLG